MKAAALFLSLACIAALVPFLPGRESPAAASGENAATWPAELVPDTWNARPLGPREARFAAGFPGRIGVFATPRGDTVIVRRIDRPTRQLHPAADCLRALGHAVSPGPIRRDAQGRDWHTLTATRDGETTRVRERIFDEHGRQWTDLSAWYWSAALGRTRAPWWAMTELAPLPREAAHAEPGHRRQ